MKTTPKITFEKLSKSFVKLTFLFVNLEPYVCDTFCLFVIGVCVSGFITMY